MSPFYIFSDLRKSSSEEPEYLPVYNRKDLMILKFLGSGAFGEVYEGVASRLNDEKETKVAIKVEQNITVFYMLYNTMTVVCNHEVHYSKYIAVSSTGIALRLFRDTYCITGILEQVGPVGLI